MIYFALHREAVRWPFPSHASLTSVSRARTHLYTRRLVLDNNSHIGIRLFKVSSPRGKIRLSVSVIISLSLPLSHIRIHTLSIFIYFCPALTCGSLLQTLQYNNINTIARISLHITHTHTHTSTRTYGISWWRWTSKGTRLGSPNK